MTPPIVFDNQRHYMILADESCHNLEYEVNQAILRGWIPHGSMSVREGGGRYSMYYQPMIASNPLAQNPEEFFYDEFDFKCWCRDVSANEPHRTEHINDKII